MKRTITTLGLSLTILLAAGLSFLAHGDPPGAALVDEVAEVAPTVPELAAPSTELMAPDMDSELVEVPGTQLTGDPLADAATVVKSIRSGNWRLVAAAALSLFMFFLMKYRDSISWFGTTRGAAVLLMILSLGGGFSTSLATSQPINLALLLSVVGTALTAAGGYHWIKSVFFPKDKDPAETLIG